MSQKSNVDYIYLKYIAAPRTCLQDGDENCTDDVISDLE